MAGEEPLLELGYLAMPVLSIRLGTSERVNDPTLSTTRQAYDLLADGFGPGFNGPLELVAQTSGPADLAALRALEASLPSWRTWLP